MLVRCTTHRHSPGPALRGKPQRAEKPTRSRTKKRRPLFVALSSNHGRARGTAPRVFAPHRLPTGQARRHTRSHRGRSPRTLPLPAGPGPLRGSRRPPGAAPGTRGPWKAGPCGDGGTTHPPRGAGVPAGATLGALVPDHARPERGDGRALTSAWSALRRQTPTAGAAGGAAAAPTLLIPAPALPGPRAPPTRPRPRSLAQAQSGPRPRSPEAWAGRSPASWALRPEVEGRNLVSRAPRCRKLCSRGMERGWFFLLRVSVSFLLV